MTLKKLIKALQKELKQHGDVPCQFSTFDLINGGGIAYEIVAVTALDKDGSVEIELSHLTQRDWDQVSNVQVDYSRN